MKLSNVVVVVVFKFHLPCLLTGAPSNEDAAATPPPPPPVEATSS